MASAAQDLRYRRKQGMVDGSLAHDLDWVVRERELERAGELPRRRETVVETPKIRTAEKAKVQVRERQRVSPLTLIGFAVVMAMTVLVLMNYIQLTMLSADTVSLQNQLSVLETEQVRLTAQYEQMFDLATVQEAAEEAGMVKPGSSQICYIDLSAGDSAVVYQKEDPSALSGVLTSLHHSALAVVEYFK